MSVSLLKRIETLESQVSGDIVIIAITDKGEEVKARVKDVIEKDGTLKEGFSGIGNSEHSRLILKGNSLKDLDRIIKSYFSEASRYMENKLKTQNSSLETF